MKFEYKPKSKDRLSAWFSFRDKERLNGFEDRQQFYTWFQQQQKVCCFCGLTEEESQKIALLGLIKSKRFPQGGVTDRGKARGVWLEITRDDPSKNFTVENSILACYWCNNDKSDLFTAKEYKKFSADRVGYLRKLLTALSLVIIVACVGCKSNVISEADAQAIIAQQVKQSSVGAVSLIRFQKMEGEPVNGKDAYSMTFKMKLKFEGDAHQHINEFGTPKFYSDSAYKQVIQSRGGDDNREFYHYKKGQEIEFEFTNEFDKDASGWKY
ncbi:MAG TPA: hypothetical protein VEA58_06580 [Anaerovoracaceae bacterium]|nr:hypothetical protein [Anaerovoracaceae bacterium]